jgi:hypothetical protein
MNLETLKTTIRQELPHLLRLDPEFRSYIVEITRQECADRHETRDRFHEILDEMRRDREKQDEKWDEQNRKWDEQNHKWDEQNRKWNEQNHKWDEQNHKWEEQNRLWREQWTEHQRQHTEEFNKLHEEIMALAKKHDRSIGALGARWGMQSEKSFRNALAGILEENFGVEVLNINDYDEQGVVFGRPDQIELDVIIKNGLLLICELKSSIGKADIHIFERKARFYESRHNCKANRLIVISPMIDPKAQKLADRLHIQTFSDSEEVESLENL